jgi:hypothetical protein
MGEEGNCQSHCIFMGKTNKRFSTLNFSRDWRLILLGKAVWRYGKAVGNDEVKRLGVICL